MSYARAGRGRLRISPAWGLLAPFGLLFMGLYVAPVLWSLRESVYADRLVGGETFVGFDSYSRALGDPSFLNGFSNVSVLSAIQIPICLMLALLIALALDGRAVVAPGVFRLGVFIPYAV